MGLFLWVGFNRKKGDFLKQPKSYKLCILVYYTMQQEIISNFESLTEEDCTKHAGKWIAVNFRKRR